MLVAITRDVSPRISECELTFMDREPIDLEVAARQLDNYRAALEKCGVLIRSLPPDDRYPDSCFVEDAAVVVDEVAVITSMGAASRRGGNNAIEGEAFAFRKDKRR